jgi:hypothetical protein
MKTLEHYKLEIFLTLFYIGAVAFISWLFT